MRSRLFLVLLVPAAAVLVPMSLFTVDRTEFVYLTRFGRHVATYDGADDSQAGLHVKWPWPVESVLRLDRRLQYFDITGAELLTRDPRGNTIDKTLTLDAFVCWRIADASGVDRFIRAVGTPDGAQAILNQRVSSDLGAAVSRMELGDLITTDPDKVDRERERLRQRLLDEPGAGSTPSLRTTAARDYGIEVVDIRLRRSSHPPAVRQAIFERIRSERDKKSEDYRTLGKREADDIRSRGIREASELKARADAEALRLRGEAEAEADRIRNEAQSKDPQFYAFLRKLEEYQRILGDNKSMLLLSTHRELFDVLFNPPAPGNAPPRTAGEPAKDRGNMAARRGGS
jgi:membrane protease subunit HflC